MVLAILQVNSLVQLILCGLCLFFILLLQLYVLLFINLCLNQLVPIVRFNILWQLCYISFPIPVSKNRCLCRYHSRFVKSCPGIGRFACVSLIIRLRNFSTFLIPFQNVVLVVLVLTVPTITTVIINWKLELWLGPLNPVVALGFWHTIVC